MIFNNQLVTSNVIGSCYVGGNVLFHRDVLYSPILNYVKKIDLSSNSSSVLPLQTHNQIRSLTISPNGIVLIAIDMAGYAVIFNLKGNFVVGEFNFKGSVNCAEYSEDGKLFAIAQNHGFYVYEAPPFWRTFQPFVLLKKYKNKHSSDIISLRFSPDSRFLATCGSDNIIYLNNLFTIHGYLPVTLEVHKYKIVSVYFSTDMQYIYSIDSGSNVYVWKWTNQLTQNYNNYRQAKLKLIKNRKNHHEELEEEDEKQFFSEFEKGVNEGRYILAKKLTITQSGAYLKRVYYQPKNGFFTVGYSSGSFTIYKLIQEELTLIQTFSVGSNKISSLAVNDSCTWIALAIKDYGQIIVWEWKSQSYIINQKGFTHNTEAIASMGKLIATGTSEGEVKLWDKASGFCVATFKEHESAITDIKFSNQTTLFSSGLDGSVNAYDTVKYRSFRKFKADRNCQLTSLTVDESGDIVFAGSFDPYEIFAWNVKTANILQIIRGHEGPISCIQIGGERLISGSWDRTLKIHQIYSRKLNVETLDHTSQITALAMHPNRKQIAVATIKGQIYIWELENAQLLGIINSELEGGRSYFSKVSSSNDTNSKYLKALTYSSCGNYLIGGGKSKYLMIYDVRHRMVFKKIELTRNRDLQGVVDKLNSKFVKEGNSTYEMLLEEQQKGLSDDDDTALKLPGSKKVDVSEIRRKLQVDVKKIVLLSHNSIAVNTSFGVLIYSSNLNNKTIFNPYELLPTITPETVIELLKNKQYSPALIAAIQLNLPIKNVLKKIPIQFIKQTINQIDSNKLTIMLEKLAEGSADMREAQWIQAILMKDIEIPQNLRFSLENLHQQAQLLNRTRAMLQVSDLMNI